MDVREYAERYAFMREPARRATMAYQNAARYYDQLKEIVLVELGLVHTSETLHRLAHWFPGQFDAIGDILHQHHILQDYGGTREFPGVSLDLGDVFQMAVELLDEIIGALEAFIRDCEAQGCGAAARQLEGLEIAASEKKTRLLDIWTMFENADSPTSFDSWVKGTEV